MSQQHWHADLTRVAGEDLSAARYHVAALDSDGEVMIADESDTYLVGIIQDYPEADEAVRVTIAGCSKAVAGGEVAVGDPLASDDEGRVVTADTNAQAIVGYALEAAAAEDEIIEIRVEPGQLVVQAQ